MARTIQTKEPTNKKKKGSALYIILIVICIAVIVFALYNIIPTLQEDSQSATLYDDLKQYTSIPDNTQEVSGELSAQDIGRTIDFDALKTINPDIVGWITIPNTRIDYPIVAGPDNDYYISHSANKERNRAGAIFLDAANSRDFSDPNTIIYGHRMNSGAMFGTLKQYQDRAFFNENRHVLIYTPDHTFVYEVFATYTTPDISDTYTLFSGGGPEFLSYLETMAKKADFPIDTDFTETSRIITLSTCTQYQADKRYILQAVLIDETA